MTTPIFYEANMSSPFGLCSDIHSHNWNAFSSLDANGLNTRLVTIGQELLRCAAEVKKLGGHYMLVAGDLFHQRGSIDSEVFNYIHNVFAQIADSGIEIYGIPGNHDLKTRDTTALGNAFKTFDAIDNMTVFHKPTLYDLDDFGPVLFMPWYADTSAFRAELEKQADRLWDQGLDVGTIDVICHAPINKVIEGLPDHGNDADDLATIGFRRIFAGHYHNHKVMADGKVISIGATTHQTWSDVGSKAGFLIVYPDRFDYQASWAPSFIEINETTDEEDIPLMVSGNYVRVRGLELDDSDIIALRKELADLGALGVSVEVPRKTVSARSPSAATSGVTTLEASISAYVDEKAPKYIEEVRKRSLDVLNTARAATS